MIVDDAWGPVLEQARHVSRHVRAVRFRWSCDCGPCASIKSEIRDLLCEVERVDSELSKK